MYGLGDVSDMRFLALGAAFHAHVLVDAYMIRYQSLSAVFIVQIDISDMRFRYIG